MSKKFFVTCVLIVLALVATVGCRRKKDERIREKDHVSESDDLRPDPVAVVPSPARLPQMDPMETASEFPEIVKVPAPSDLRDKLETMVPLITAENWKEKSEGLKMLKEIAAAHSENMHLIRYLVSLEDPEIVARGIRMMAKLKNHDDFVPVAVSLMGHPSDEVRAEAVALLTYGLQVDEVREAFPFVRALLGDKSCNVRRRALAVILGNNRRLRLDVRDVVQKMKGDPCPAVHALAIRNLGNVLLAEDVDEELIKELLKEAGESPYYLNRCSAMTALGGLVKAGHRYDEKGKLVSVPQEEVKGLKTFPDRIVDEVTKTLAGGLTIAVMPSMTVQYEDGRTPYTFSNHSSLPACAADALASHFGEGTKGDPVERVRTWRERMAARGWSTKPPQKLCTGRRDCRKDGEICYKMECVPVEKVVPLYWDYIKKEHCRKKPAEKSMVANFGDELVVEMGLGLHWMFRHDVRKYLREKDEEGFSKRFAAIRSLECD